MFARSLLAFVVLAPGLAGAHIHLTSPLGRTDALTGDQKIEHCGGKARDATRVTTFMPGQTITVTWMETINHPGHFRISFQPDGDVFEIPPAGSGPPSGYPSVDQTGMTDAASGSIILADFIADGTSSKDVTLPNMECNNCTLQFIQVMTDKPPYTTDANSDDIYFNCADLILSNSAPPPSDGPPTPGQEASIDPPGGGGDATGGCCSSSRGAPGAAALGLLVLGLVLRRRR